MGRERRSSLSFFVTALFGLFLNVCGETCMKAVHDGEADEEDDGRHMLGGNQRHPPRWRWINFECSSGCCGQDSIQYCCFSKESFVENDLIVGVAVGGIVIVIATIVIVVICCICHRRKRKRLTSRPTVLARLSFSSTSRPGDVTSRPSDVSLPPSYEMSTRRAEPAEVYGAFPAELFHSHPLMKKLLVPRHFHCATYTLRRPRDKEVQVCMV
ncbi:uncharacterized protein LOC112571710 [Pomacea canaliculata]|uniref:uncharacterized protein LOC112571710 n=1 Tax=Pomacea canaliculata TaxID=400727 RepID=UPI000D73FF10|nr:uncharacterized protein LOC112571710 [Pomacea canaliculata]